MPHNHIGCTGAFLPHVLTLSSASSYPLTRLESFALSACQRPDIYRLLIFHNSRPLKVYRIGDNAPHASLSLWHKLNCLNAIHLTVVRAVRCAHLGQPLASNSDSVTTVTADTFEQAGCLFLLSV